MEKIKYTIRNVAFCLCMMFLFGGIVFPVQAAPVEAVRQSNDPATTGERVRLNGDRIRIEADQLTYDLENETVVAEGNVIVTAEDAVYHTESIIYRMKDRSGTMSAFKGTVKTESRDLLLTGAGVKLSENETLVTDAGVTRCPLEKPHYQFTAKAVTITGRVVHLEKVVIRLKEVPVFYLPKLLINLEQKLPNFETGFSDKKGFRFQYSYLATITPNFKLSLESDLTSRDESKVGIGLESEHNDYYNKLLLYYNFDSFWEISDIFRYENENWLFTLDGTHHFSETDERELGVALTRKYWNTSLGRWQVGILARDAYKEEGTTSYGGFYTGWRLDYNPHPNLVFSYLGIPYHNGKDYGDLLDDYGLGDNWLYKIEFPVKGGYTLGMNGVYNSDGDGWIHQTYSISHESCCFKTYLGYDAAEDSFELRWNIKF